MAEASGGLVHGYRLGSGKLEDALTWPDVEAWRPEQGRLWIHLAADHESVLKWLTEKSGLMPGEG